MHYYAILFPAAMILMPAIFLGLWCLWTGVRAMGPVLFATLGVLAAFGASAWLMGPERSRHTLHVQLWGLGGFFLLLWGVALPALRRAFAALPAAPRAASLRPRQLELFAGALQWPFVAWAGLLAVGLLAVPRGSLITYIGPAVGFLSLIVMRFVLPLGVQEPEPLGGADPEGLARRYAAFRRRRVLLLYWMTVVLALIASSTPLMPRGPSGGLLGALGGTLFGLLGGIFGTWADAQRYLLRLQLSGSEPPG